jgi:hypothetical protein
MNVVAVGFESQGCVETSGGELIGRHSKMDLLKAGDGSSQTYNLSEQQSSYAAPAPLTLHVDSPDQASMADLGALAVKESCRAYEVVFVSVFGKGAYHEIAIFDGAA